jgi:hypothetical protein
VLLLAGCGGAATKPATKPVPATPKRHCPPPAVVQRKLKLLRHDLVVLRRVAKAVPESAQPDGNAAIGLATNRFLLDESTSGVGIYVRSRFIDIAAAIVNVVCRPCWNSLEANRPFGGTGPTFRSEPLDCTRRRL